MPNIVRKVGADVTLFTLDATDYIGVIEGATINIEIATENVGAVRDGWNYDVPVGASWSLDADAFINDFPLLMLKAATDDRMITVVVTSAAGGQKYDGEAVIKSVGHTLNRQGAQKVKIQLVGHGPLVPSDAGA